MWSGEDLRMDAKQLVFPKDWTTCSKYVDHSRFNSQHNLGGGGRGYMTT